MKVTADANVLFAALMRDSTTRRIWFNPALRLFAPAFILPGFRKCQNTIEKKFKGTPEEFNRALERALEPLQLVPDSELKPFLPAAQTLCADPKDWMYLACALKEGTIRWSNDAGFRHQPRIPVKTTAEMMQAGLL